MLLKHSAQTPLCAERFFASFRAGGLPKGLFQFLHLSHADTTRVISAEAYKQSLVYNVMQAHPPGAKQPGYGSWSQSPEAE